VSPALVEFALAHELNHAVEDQAFDLSDRLGTGDRDLALTALVEGSATVTMIRYARRFQNPIALALAAEGIDSGTAGVPPFILHQLLFAYTAGARFVGALYDQTHSWALVDHALESDPPVSSEQIMHPRKYLLNEGPEEFAFAYSVIAGSESARPRIGTLGEFATREMLGSGPEAARAAGGWGGDDWQLRRELGAPRSCDDEETCRRAYNLTVSWIWDTRADAAEFRAALPGYLRSLGAQPNGRFWHLPGSLVLPAGQGRITTLTFIPL
jgi:hypothetical protein